MEVVGNDGTAIQWSCPHGCTVQFANLPPAKTQLDEDGDLVRVTDVSMVGMGTVVHMRLMHGYPKSDEDDE